MNDLIKVVQLPVIEERLRSMKEQVDKRVEEALALVCTDDTVKSVKAMRADLNKEFQALETDRKAVKAAIMTPYEQFEGVYKECVSDAYRRADVALKGKIDDVEREIKARCESGLREYFAELCALERLDWLRYKQAGVVVDMASARQKTPEKLRFKLRWFTQEVSKAVSAISTMDHAEEIMAEYKDTLDATAAISKVQERHRRMEAERASLEARREDVQREAEAVARVEAIAPPVRAEHPQEAEKIYVCTFTVRGTRSDLKKLKEFMIQEGIQYEQRSSNPGTAP